MNNRILSICLTTLSLFTVQARAETVRFDFDPIGVGANSVYGSMDGFPTMTQNGFVVDVAQTGTIQGGLLHWHHLDGNMVNLPLRPDDKKGVLVRDAITNQDPLFFAPVRPTFTFSLQSLVVGTTPDSSVQASSVRASAWRGGNLLATVDLAASAWNYTSYEGSDLGQLAGLSMDRLEFIGLSNNSTTVFVLDDVVLQTSPVPEPETYAMFGAGLLALVWHQRRVKKSQKIGTEIRATH